jgi:hypothetical protein
MSPSADRATARHEDVPDLGHSAFVSKIGAASSFARLTAVHERFLNSTFTEHCKITCYVRLLGILRARPRKYQRHHTIIFRVVALGVSTARTRHRHRPPSKAIYPAMRQYRYLNREAGWIGGRERGILEPPPKPSSQLKPVEPQRRPHEGPEKPLALRGIKPPPALHRRPEKITATHLA